MLNATMKPLLSNKSYIHIRKPGFPVKMRDPLLLFSHNPQGSFLL